MELTVHVSEKIECLVFYDVPNLTDELKSFGRSTGARILFRKLSGDTLYVELERKFQSSKIPSHELVQQAYQLLKSRLKAGYRLAIEI